MGVSVNVGFLADMRLNDPESAENFERQLFAVNKLLVANNLSPHLEPETVPKDCYVANSSFPYSFIHRVRRIYAHIVEEPNWKATPCEEGETPNEDRVLTAQSEMMQSHLLTHSDAQGYYVPIDFDEVLFDPEDAVAGGMVGSSYRLMEELQIVAPCLGITLDHGFLPDAECLRIEKEFDRAESPFTNELVAWLALFEAARLSIKYNTLVVFT